MYLVIIILSFALSIEGVIIEENLKYSPPKSTMHVTPNGFVLARIPTNIPPAQLTVRLANPLQVMSAGVYKGQIPTETVTTSFWHFLLSFMVNHHYQNVYFVRHQEKFEGFGTSDITIQPSARAGNHLTKRMIIELKRWGVNLQTDEVRNQLCDMILGYEEDYGLIPIGVTSNGNDVFFYACETQYAQNTLKVAENGSCDCAETARFQLFAPPVGVFNNQDVPFTNFDRNRVVDLVDRLTYAFEFSDLDDQAKANKLLNPANNPVFLGQY